MSVRRPRVPPARRLLDLSTRAYAALVVLLVVVVVLVAALANPGHRNGPVRPARPPVASSP